MCNRKLEAKWYIEEMMYKGWKESTVILGGEWDEPIDQDLIDSCYEMAKEIGIEIELTWMEGERLFIRILTPFK